MRFSTKVKPRNDQKLPSTNEIEPLAACHVMAMCGFVWNK
jgi:hypothetical protein